jgi:hypothetical protein
MNFITAPYQDAILNNKIYQAVTSKSRRFWEDKHFFVTVTYSVSYFKTKGYRERCHCFIILIKAA